MNKTINLTLMNKSKTDTKPQEVAVRSRHSGDVAIALANKDNLLLWFGELKKDKLWFVEASVITSYGETRFFIQSHKAA